MSSTASSFPKKIQRDSLQSLRLQYDKDTINVQKSDKVFLISPFASSFDSIALQHALVADFLRRMSGGKLKISINPVLHQLQSSNPDIIWTTRQDILTSFGKVLDKLAIVSDELLSTTNVLDIQTIHEYTTELYGEHQLAARWDVCYYNIYTSTAVPDHRVVYKLIDAIRYHIRFFFGSKNDTIIATLDDPCLLFGCVALLVHPQDRRYKKLLGKEILIPLINKSIPIVAHESVKQEGYGTHLLIPAHNREDFSLALELGLSYDIYAIDQYGNFTEVAKEFKGKHKDEFESNIVQFIDDIANLDRKEETKLLIPTDSLTGNTLLPLLQKNVYLPLGDCGLEDDSLVVDATFAGLNLKIRNEIEKEEQWCISSYDFIQPYMPFSLQDDYKISEVEPLRSRLIKDLYLLNIISFPAKGETVIQGLLFEINDTPLWKLLFQYYTSLYTFDDLASVERILSSLSSAIGEEYVKILDDMFAILDSIPGIHSTLQGYMLDQQSLFRYDHEYLSILLLLKTYDFDYTYILYDESQSYWVKYLLFLYNKIYKKRLSKPSFISLLTSQESPYIQNSLQSYPGDVVRMALLSRIRLSGEGDAGDIYQEYSNDYMYRFLMKRRNAMRVVWSEPKTLHLYRRDSIENYIQQSQQEFSDYDVWILTKIRYVWEEFNYYSNKYAFNKAFHIVIENLWYDIGEWMLFILKFSPSSHTKNIANIVTYLSCHLLYPFSPTTVIGMMSVIDMSLNIEHINELFETINLKKNYKCTLMMDAMIEWVHLINSHKNTTKYTLCIQTNKDFSDYIVKQSVFIITYFGGADIVSLDIQTELDVLPEGWIGKDLLTMKVGIIVEKNNGSRSDALQTTTGVSILQGQLAYKKQLLQTMRNTIMRMHSSNHQKESLSQLENDTLLLQKEIEQIEYQISKMKYF